MANNSNQNNKDDKYFKHFINNFSAKEKVYAGQIIRMICPVKEIGELVYTINFEIIYNLINHESIKLINNINKQLIESRLSINTNILDSLNRKYKKKFIESANKLFENAGNENVGIYLKNLFEKDVRIDFNILDTENKILLSNCIINLIISIACIREYMEANGDAFDICTTCKKQSNIHSLPKCAQCLVPRYCNQDCQKKHWNCHKEECKKLTNIEIPENVIDNINKEIIIVFKKCSNCLKYDDLKLCIICKNVYYCNDECQTKHLEIHKKECEDLAKRQPV